MLIKYKIKYSIKGHKLVSLEVFNFFYVYLKQENGTHTKIFNRDFNHLSGHIKC